MTEEQAFHKAENIWLVIAIMGCSKKEAYDFLSYREDKEWCPFCQMKVDFRAMLFICPVKWPEQGCSINSNPCCLHPSPFSRWRTGISLYGYDRPRVQAAAWEVLKTIRKSARRLGYT